MPTDQYQEEQESVLSGQVSSNTSPDTLVLKGDFTVDGIQGQTLFNPGVSPDILVMTRRDMSRIDHLFIHYSTRENFSDEDLLPGTTFFFNGAVQSIDAGAGSFYYIDYGDGIGIDTFEKTKEAEKSDINQLLNSYEVCETDSDCIVFHGKCPFDSPRGINSKFSEVAQNLINHYLSWQTEPSELICNDKSINIKNVKCNNYACRLILL
ncbi:hypothetical protein AGMMS50249_4870 [candidate division SR1 bacterium]|nr:hypothetical protein AGMMS50249_4870 [candidate division SR1 bacterium]